MRATPTGSSFCAGVFLAVGLAVSCTGTRVPEATVKMQSTSPDGEYRCVVKEQLPHAGYARPHVYTFTIRNKRTDLSLNRFLQLRVPGTNLESMRQILKQVVYILDSN